MKKTNLSPAEKSRLLVQEAEERKNTEEKQEQERLAQFIRNSNKRIGAEKVKAKRDSIPIGEKLYSFICKEIIEAAKNGEVEVSGAFYSYLCEIGEEHIAKTCGFLGDNEKLAKYAFDYAAKKLRLDGYQVRFGRYWTCEYPTNMYESNKTETVYGTKWESSAFGKFSLSGDCKFSESIEMETSWMNEEKKKD